MYNGFASSTLISRNHSWKPSAEIRVIPGGRLPWSWEGQYATWQEVRSARAMEKAGGSPEGLAQRKGGAFTLESSFARRFVANPAAIFAIQ